ncbi:MAG: ribosome biogenesis GTPase YlqF [Granulosicoccus sp.]|nr:ribosome biogenesis GTPase YlqF [Granulosicoccus sp.]
MKIQWFPGHMHKAQKEIRQVLSGIDVVIEVLDARIPYSSQNPLLAGILSERPRLRILNKRDLADPGMTAQWLEHLAQEAQTTVLATCREDASTFRDMPSLCRELAPETNRERPVHALIVGIPNSGKSTIINRLAGLSVAKTGNEPAVTRAQQRIDIGHGVVLRDTPGVLWPNLENRAGGYRLAVTGAIRDTAIDSADVAMFAAEFLQQHYPERLQERYEWAITADAEALSVLEHIGHLRGCLGGGGLVDLDRVARMLLTDIRSGQLGPLTFETPETMQREEQEIVQERNRREADKKERTEKRRARHRQQRKKN